MQGYANWGGLVKELGCQIVTSFSHLLHLCDDAFEARQQFFDKRSGKPITSQVLRSIDTISMSFLVFEFCVQKYAIISKQTHSENSFL